MINLTFSTSSIPRQQSLITAIICCLFLFLYFIYSAFCLILWHPTSMATNASDSKKAKNEIKNRKHFEFILRGGETERDPDFVGKIKENGKN